MTTDRALTAAAKRTALDDQVLAFIRDADPLPTGTGDIGAHLGSYTYRDNRCGHPAICTEPKHWTEHELAVHPGYLVLSACKRLARKGFVERIDLGRGRLNPTGQLHWRYLGQQ